MSEANPILMAVGSILVAIVVIVAIIALREFLKSEFWSKNKDKFLVFRTFVEAAIIQVADAYNSGVDMSVYEEKADKWETEKGVKLDPRMWAVLDKIEKNPLFGGWLEFDMVVTLVEGWYQALRKANNGLVLNPAKDIVSAEEGTSVEGTLIVEVPAN